MISVIVPSLNEAQNIVGVLEAAGCQEGVELIVADGGSSDNTVLLASSCGAKVVMSSPGKARQMNAGAAKASGDILLFLHADTLLPQGFQDQVCFALSEPTVAGGAFRLRFMGERGFLLRLVECTANWRARYLQLPFGDQAIFLKRKTFDEIGGYRELPLMEDLEILERLKRKGRIVILPSSVRSSPRRYHKDGTIKRIFINKLVFLGYFLGVSYERLSRWYRGFPSTPNPRRRVSNGPGAPGL